MSRLRSDSILLLTAIIWGSAFVAQRVAAQYLGVFLFNGLRFLLAALLMLPFVSLRQVFDRRSFAWTAAAGAVLFTGSALQQAGLQYTTAGNAGFITSLYVVLVPVLLLILFRRQSHWLSWLAALIAIFGAWLLSANGQSLQLAPGDGFELLGALVWALHVIVVEKAVHRMPVLPFAVGQFFVSALFNLLLGLGWEAHTLPGLLPAWWTVAYVGVFSTAIGYTLQALGQRHAPAVDAALIFSLESVFAALTGYFFLQELLLPLQILGCGLILAAVALAQLKGRPAV